MPLVLREIKSADNSALAAIIREIFEEFDAPREGSVYSDHQTDHLYELFRDPGSRYFVTEEDGVVTGGCGVYPTEGLPNGCAELVKFYLSPAARGRGIGKMLLQKCFEAAIQLHYRQLYLESFPQFDKAIGIYEKAGFKKITQALGNSGHTACTIWMIKDLPADGIAAHP